MALLTAGHLGLDPVFIVKAVAADFEQPAKRPSRTGFSIGKARKELGFNPVSFEEGLKKTFE